MQLAKCWVLWERSRKQLRVVRVRDEEGLGEGREEDTELSLERKAE